MLIYFVHAIKIWILWKVR